MPKHRNIIIGVGVFVVNRDNMRQVLVSRRRKGSKLGVGRVSLPGGKIEEMEKLIRTAIRETKEETGLDVWPRLMNGHSYVFHAEEWFREGKHVWTIYVVADVQGGVLANPEPDKHEDWEWKTVDELMAMCGPDDWIPLDALRVLRGSVGL